MFSLKTHAHFQFEKNAFLLAVSFLTCFPINEIKDYSSKLQNHAVAYYPVVGGMIGGISALVWFVCEPVFGTYPAAIITVVSSVLITGGLHEDGLADTCDGLFGGKDTQHKLQIMKDSQVGAYGVMALWLSLSLRVALIASLSNPVMMIITAASISRTGAVLLGLLLPYQQVSAVSKCKNLLSDFNTHTKGILLLGLVVALWFAPAGFLYSVLIFALLFAFCYAWFKHAIGGYTGDCLGAAQQLTELAFYLLAVALMLKTG